MSVETLPIHRTFFMSDGFGIEPKVYRAANGGKTFAGVAVFRSGTFRDSMGDQTTWEPLHITQMVDNFNHLRTSKVMESVPVRDGHPGFLINNIPGKGAVVGWHDNIATKMLRSPVDGQEYNYILADYTITEPYALEKIANGTWRNRSAEVGSYTTNSEAQYYPFYAGFAFVDLPAVEGLNFSSSQGKFYAFLNGAPKERVVDGNQQGAGGVLNLPPVFPPVQQHTAPQATPPFMFSIGGQNETDPNKVQAYINSLQTRNGVLEQFAKDTRDAGRKSFVTGLVTAKKILATQEEQLAAFAASLTDEQFETWKKSWDAAPTQSLLGNHGSGVSNPSNQAQSGTNQEEQKLKDAEDIVRMHERGGVMTKNQIKATDAYRLLVKAGRRDA